MGNRREIRGRKCHRDGEGGREWIKLFFCLFLALAVGILSRIGVLSGDRVNHAIKGDAPCISWKEHTQE
ncbi:MAG: hypothetical protein IKZ21_06615, partial [Clostridia bacterium]|nr:hypothetical protein [Clostridia bacterium]